jgi:hypothetical protein
VPQTTAPSLCEVAASIRREAHTPLQLITDDEYATGLARLHHAAQTESGPVIDALDLLVQQNVIPAPNPRSAKSVNHSNRSTESAT